MFPFGEIFTQNTASEAQKVVTDGPMQLNDNTIKRDRTSSTRVLRRVPGTTDEAQLFPLVVVRKIANNFNAVTDSTRFEIPGVFWLYEADTAGAAITDYSEDYETIGAVRYRVFHNHVHTSRYQYIAVREDV